MLKQGSFFALAAIALCGLLCSAAVTVAAQGKGKGGNKVESQKGLVCKLGALTAEESERQRELIKQFRAAVKEVKELKDGYAFRLPSDRPTVLATAEWITLERMCCPFFAFALELGPEEDAVWLKITGREGVKEIIRASIKGQ
jgi:hypothetical protein